MFKANVNMNVAPVDITQQLQMPDISHCRNPEEETKTAFDQTDINQNNLLVMSNSHFIHGNNGKIQILQHEKK